MTPLVGIPVGGLHGEVPVLNVVGEARQLVDGGLDRDPQDKCLGRERVLRVMRRQNVPARNLQGWYGSCSCPAYFSVTNDCTLGGDMGNIKIEVQRRLNAADQA